MHANFDEDQVVGITGETKIYNGLQIDGGRCGTNPDA